MLCSAAAAGPLTREPYLQQVTMESALVVLGVKNPCIATLRLGETGRALEPVASDGAPRTTHVIALKNLRANTAYDYAIEVCGESVGPFTFQTAPGPGDPIQFIALGDSGTGSTAQMRVVEAMRRVQPQPQLLLALGDNAYASGTHEEFQSRFFTPMASMLRRAPVFATPGNHDYATETAQPYFDNFHLPTNNPTGTERYYSFEWGDAHIVSIDTNCAMGLAGGLCSPREQREWLIDDLRASPAKWKLVIMHHPPFSSGVHGDDSPIRGLFASLFEQGGVDLVLTGHDHDYERTYPLLAESVAPKEKRGVTYLVVGSGGAVLRKFPRRQPAWSAARNDKDYGFLDVRIDKDVLTGRLVSADGGIADEFVISKRLDLRLTATATPTKGPAPLTVAFTAVPSHEGASIAWLQGERSSLGTGPTLTHVFTEPGRYQVQVRGTLGSASTMNFLPIEVEAAPPPPRVSEPSVPPPLPSPPVDASPPPRPRPEVTTTAPPPPRGCAGNAMGSFVVTLLGISRRRATGSRTKHG
ncbi:metallophosphoesterase [Corallococcus sp. EGB]|uniref:metallophosphoesterase n=1 Tax=Corallococcus sp. EGB TaxID=1521117 RepID=UPI001CC1B68A|nr:metallophosphoesterase [Corallococcus sp. EGB]